MDIQYLGHACFKLRGKKASVVIDPYHKESVGFGLPSLSADIVLSSHNHEDHNNVEAVKGTARRKEPFVIREPGEYEIEGVSIFGYQTYHDQAKGEERGENVVFRIQLDGVSLVHVGDLGHLLDKKMMEQFGNVDVVMVPGGGVYTIGPEEAWKLATDIGAEVIIPMHYRTEQHRQDVFGKLASLDEFIKVYGGEVKRVEGKLSLSKLNLTGEGREVVVFEP